jgi:hypothetical protein
VSETAEIRIYAEFRQVLAELEMLPHGTTQSFNASGSGYADAKDPTGESFPPHLQYRAEWEGARDDARREYILKCAIADLHRFRARPKVTVPLQEETAAELEARVVREGVGWGVEETARHCRCTTTFVRKSRMKAGAHPQTGKLPQEKEPPRDKVEHAKQLAGDGLSERQIVMLTGLPKTTVRRVLGRAA